MTHEERALALCAKMGWHFEDGSPHKGTLAELVAEFAAVRAETLEEAAAKQDQTAESILSKESRDMRPFGRAHQEAARMIRALKDKP